MNIPDDDDRFFIKLIILSDDELAQLILSQSDRGQELIADVEWTLESFENEAQPEVRQIEIVTCKMVLERLAKARAVAEARFQANRH